MCIEIVKLGNKALTSHSKLPVTSSSCQQANVQAKVLEGSILSKTITLCPPGLYWAHKIQLCACLYSEKMVDVMTAYVRRKNNSLSVLITPAFNDSIATDSEEHIIIQTLHADLEQSMAQQHYREIALEI